MEYYALQPHGPGKPVTVVLRDDLSVQHLPGQAGDDAIWAIENNVARGGSKVTCAGAFVEGNESVGGRTLVGAEAFAGGRASVRETASVREMPSREMASASADDAIQGSLESS